MKNKDDWKVKVLKINYKDDKKIRKFKKYC
jgi:hypothetical protein